MVSVGFFGAAGEVTGSNFLVDAGTRKYIVDCGLFQGSRDASDENAAPFAYKAAEVDAVLVTHAHLDHIGRLPKLFKEGFRGPVYATAATIELTRLVLEDAIGIMQERHEHDPGVAILYDEQDLRRALAHMKPVKYHERFDLGNGDAVTYFDAGHILGSASLLLEVDGKRISFSGDLGHEHNPLLPHWEVPEGVDACVIEGTYGGVEHKDNGNRLDVIRKAMEWTVQNRGVLLVPAFSIERSQELLYLLNYLFLTKQLPRIPIYLDSPLAIDALEIFEKHLNLLSKEVQELRKRDSDVFEFKGLFLAPTSQESREINDEPPPKMIIAGSGMMVGGRIIHHLKRYLSHPKTYLLVIGYQAKGTLGDDIINGAKSVKIHGSDVEVNAKVEVVDIFSGHADHSELVEWVTGAKVKSGGKVMIVHSEEERANALQAALKEKMPSLSIVTTKDEQVIQL